MEVRENASDYIDGDSAVSLAQRVKNHIGLCDHCDGWVKSLATTVGLIRQLPQEEVPPSLRQKIRSIAKSE
jgi:predicted anti-sigma-YlaC factor YlaD